MRHVRAFRDGLLRFGEFDDDDLEFEAESTRGITGRNKDPVLPVFTVSGQPSPPPHWALPPRFILGFFEVTLDGELVHSKKDGQGFPDDNKVKAICAMIDAKLST